MKHETKIIVTLLAIIMTNGVAFQAVAGDSLVGSDGYSREFHVNHLQQMGRALEMTKRNISLVKQCREFKVLQSKYIPAIIVLNNKIKDKLKRARLTENKRAPVSIRWGRMVGDLNKANKWLDSYLGMIRSNQEIVSGDMFVVGKEGDDTVKVPDQDLGWLQEKLEDLQFTMVSVLSEGYNPEVKSPQNLIYLDFNRRYLDNGQR